MCKNEKWQTMLLIMFSLKDRNKKSKKKIEFRYWKLYKQREKTQNTIQDQVYSIIPRKADDNMK